MHAKMQVFLAANAHFTDSIVWKTQKLCLERSPPGKTLHFAYVICGKQKGNQRTKIGDYVFL